MRGGVPGSGLSKDSASGFGHTTMRNRYVTVWGGCRCETYRFLAGSETAPSQAPLLGQVRLTVPVARLVLFPACLLMALSWPVCSTSAALVMFLTVLTVWAAGRAWGTKTIWPIVAAFSLIMFVDRSQTVYGTIFAAAATLLAVELREYYRYVAGGLFRVLRDNQIVVARTGFVGESELVQDWVGWVEQAIQGLPYARAVINFASPTPIVIVNGSRNVTVNFGHSLGPCLTVGRNLSLDFAGPSASQGHDFLAKARFRRVWWGLGMVRFLAKTINTAPTRLQSCR